MKKLKLNVEELTVEQFTTEVPEDEGAGSVQAYVATNWWSGCPVHTCYC